MSGGLSAKILYLRINQSQKHFKWNVLSLKRHEISPNANISLLFIKASAQVSDNSHVQGLLYTKHHLLTTGQTV